MKGRIPGHKQEGHGECRSRNQRITASDGKSCIATPADPHFSRDTMTFETRLLRQPAETSRTRPVGDAKRRDFGFFVIKMSAFQISRTRDQTRRISTV
jgi:hypothetical protein